MADHPLRPATDRSLGEPLPHQQANRARDHPRTAEAFPPEGVCGISRRFQRLSPILGQVPTCYSPVRHFPQAEACFTFDLHVLSMPPAFVLSQDQTLKLYRRLSSANEIPSHMRNDATNNLPAFTSTAKFRIKATISMVRFEIRKMQRFF